MFLFPSPLSLCASFFTFLLFYHPFFSSLFTYCRPFTSRFLSSPLRFSFLSLSSPFSFFPSFCRHIFSCNLFCFIFFPHLSEYLSRYSDRIPAGRPGFDSRQEQDFSMLHRVQTGSGAHPASCTVGTGGSFPRGKATGGLKLTTHLQLVPRSRKCGSIQPLHIRLHGRVLI
jgi:hypothetical protein